MKMSCFCSGLSNITILKPRPVASKAKWLNNSFASLLSAESSLMLQHCFGSVTALSAAQTQTQSLHTDQIFFGGVMNHLTIEMLFMALNCQLILSSYSFFFYSVFFCNFIIDFVLDVRVLLPSES